MQQRWTDSAPVPSSDEFLHPCTSSSIRSILCPVPDAGETPEEVGTAEDGTSLPSPLEGALSEGLDADPEPASDDRREASKSAVASEGGGALPSAPPS
eukprot:1995126-Pyramimonas_sp.AAC.1